MPKTYFLNINRQASEVCERIDFLLACTLNTERMIRSEHPTLPVSVR